MVVKRWVAKGNYYGGTTYAYSVPDEEFGSVVEYYCGPCAKDEGFSRADCLDHAYEACSACGNDRCPTCGSDDYAITWDGYYAECPVCGRADPVR